MGQGSIIGYEINEKTCQISFYNDKEMEPQTLEVDSDNFQIPLIIGKLRDTWAYGKEAKRLATLKEGFTVARLLSRSLANEKIEFGDETYDAVWLLSQFIQMSLQSFPKIDGIVFSVPVLTEELAQMLRRIAVRMNIDKRHIFIQDYKESFCNYLFYQPKELWQYDAALFCCDRNEIKAYMLRRLKPGLGGGKTTFVTVDEVANAHMKELALVYPVLNEDKAKEADAMFCKFIQSVFDKRIVSSVFLTGEGFENNWYPKSLRVLCNGRRAFIGNNLYSKGACYTAYRKLYMHIENPVYLSETKLTDQITVNMRVDGQEKLKDVEFDVVVGPESRGFIFGVPIAYNLHKPFIPIRKKGKLPCETVSVEYELEYGTATIEMHKDAIKPGQRVVIIDDLIATGGTNEAMVKLIEGLGGKVVKTVFLMELAGLKGRERLEGYDVDAVITYPGK